MSLLCVYSQFSFSLNFLNVAQSEGIKISFLSFGVLNVDLISCDSLISILNIKYFFHHFYRNMASYWRLLTNRPISLAPMTYRIDIVQLRKIKIWYRLQWYGGRYFPPIVYNLTLINWTKIPTFPHFRNDLHWNMHISLYARV